MSFKVTKRDRNLLILLACMIIVLVCTWLLILPSLEDRSELEVSLEELEIRELEWKFEIKKLERLDENISSRKEELEECKKSFYRVLENREIDDIVTGLVLEHGLFPKSMEIEKGVPDSMPDYLYHEPQTDRKNISKGYVLIGTASVEVHGDAESWMELADDIIENYPGLRIRSFELLPLEYITEDGVVRTNIISAVIDIYMCIEMESNNQ